MLPNFCCPQVAQLIAKLEKKKLEAVATERFEYAKKIKSAIGEHKISPCSNIGDFEYAKKIKSAIGEDKISPCSNILANCKIISSTLMEQKSKPAKTTNIRRAS